MEAGLRIAEVARRSGFAPTTLRYYENIGLVTPADRTPAGYRLYDESAVERLAFIARAKQLGCSLDEIADLATAWEGGSCAPVQEHLRALLESKILFAQAHATELLALIAQLQGARRGLDHHTPDGPCDDQCGCTTDRVETVVVQVLPAPANAAPVACTLDGAQMPDRRAEWQALLSTRPGPPAPPGGGCLCFSGQVAPPRGA